MKQLFLLLSFINSILSAGVAQDLQLTSGNSQKTIKAGTFIEIELPALNQEPCDKCALNTITGQLISYADGKLNLRMKSMARALIENGKNVGYTSKKYGIKESAPIVMIPRDSVISITIKGKKKVRENTTGQVIGIALLWIGTGHLVSAPIVGLTEADEANTLVWLGLAEAFTGITMGVVFRQQQLVTNVDCPHKRKGSKIWKIN